MRPASSHPAHSAQASGKVVRLVIRDTDEELVELSLEAPRRAQAAIFEKYVGDVERILHRLLGPDPDIADLVHEVFLSTFRGLERLREPSKLRSFLIGVAVHHGRKLIRRRRLIRGFQSLVAPQDLPAQAASSASAEVTHALRASYAILERLPADDRIAFSLRCIDGMSLGEVAEVTGVSLATVKRRVTRAQAAFVAEARKNELLDEWLEGGTLT